MRYLAFIFALLAAALLAGCDMLGIESADKVAAVREADGKAVGGACRHAGRAIEDCYAIYRKANRAAIFAGWREMNDYMRENRIEAVAPQLTAQVAAASQPPAEKADAQAAEGSAQKRTTEPSKTAARSKDAKPSDS